ncbi:enoyl-CoA hydratase [Mycobacterium vicinigordonae]|uniref:Probable enoyl-CoA hydratase EchA17 n=1 Tax=Mycobacterium vicinigordonae TaxID=1719132 RepID=A0A7D6I7Q1_9MYCO|nr:enoyl-CoA hydratase [Mycobacterium vicinigordonae]QLL09018.1 enoyl-CoA hydratase [Mycobacterium vicinigordonae]
MSEFVSVVVSDGSQDAGLAMLLLSRSPTNAMTRQVYREIIAAADELGRREDVSAVILFGGHEIFSAGDDIPELRTLDAAGAGTAARVRCEAIDAVAAIPKPTVAAITGYALGAGLTLALAADWRVSGDNVKFGATEILAGLVPGGDGMARLTHVVGASRAKELVFSGRFFDAEEALALGLIDDMVAPDDVYDAAAVWARRFLEGPSPALAAAKAGINDVYAACGDLGRRDAEQRRYVEVFAAGQRGGADRDS